ncbi:MAG: hypothetical protein WD599_06450, partial [Balneolaceae bacterium]
PIGVDPGYEPLAGLAREAWQKLEESDGMDLRDVDPESAAFVIFHAGVGRDLELTGTSLDQTPQDIPSLFLSQQALGDLLNEPSFAGFPMNAGDFRIPHTIIAPRTLNRRGTDVNGDPYVLPLSINGLLAAQIGSRLGLPDLFNTDNGRSGIGRFGLMDGAGMFAFNGLFPPEPSAWEKIYLGWETSFEITPRKVDPVSLPAASRRVPGSIARVHLSPDEYFLIENRHRDPEGDGVTLTIRQPDGTLTTQTLTNREIGAEFISSGIDVEPDLEPGVLIDASNFDWALPGGFDPGTSENDERELNGGILIWHIDEAVIRRFLSDNRINANPNHRGVELKEADGARDIGRPTDVGLTDNHPNGWTFDFWWEGNNASVFTQTSRITLYRNRFGPDTTPNNKSHTGAWPFFELTDFSENLPVASFNIQPVTDPNLEISLHADLQLDESFHTPDGSPHLRRYPYGLRLFRDEDRRFLIAPGLNAVHAISLGDSTGPAFTFPPGSYRQPLSAETLVLSRPSSDDQHEISAWQWNEEQETFSRRWVQSVSRPWPGLISSADGDTLLLDHSNQRILLDSGLFLNDLAQPEQSTARIGGYQAILSGTHLEVLSHSLLSPLGEAEPDHRAYAGLLNFADDQLALFLLGEDKMYLYQPNEAKHPELLVESGFLDWPAIADLNADGSPEIIYVNPLSGSLEAVNLNGATSDHFPFFPPGGV